MKRIFFLTCLLPSILIAQHTIKGTFSPPEKYKGLLLYKATPTMSKYVSSFEFKKDGEFQFNLDSTATKGIYRIVYGLPKEDYNFDIIYNGKEDIELTFNSETGVEFTKSKENKLLSSYINSLSLATQNIGNYYSQNNTDPAAIKAIFKTQRETQEQFEKAAKETIALQFIKANKPYIPKNNEDVKTYSDNLRNHYFDYIDFNNETLQSSGFLEEKILNYVFGMVDETTDEITNYKKNIDVVYAKIKDTSPKIKRIFLLRLFQQMVDLNLESVVNYISENYLMDVAIILNDQELLQVLKVYKNISLGNKAPDFSFEIKNNQTTTTTKLSELSLAENYIVLFWSSTCSHCLNMVPKLKAYINTLEKGFVKVVAFGLEDSPKNWQEVIKNYPEFIHVYGKGKWSNPIVKEYGIKGTPSYFILNKEKEIIAKPDNLKALKTFLENQK